MKNNTVLQAIAAAAAALPMAVAAGNEPSGSESSANELSREVSGEVSGEASREEPADEGLAGFSLRFENDVLFPEKNEDRDYTMGVVLEFDGKFVDRSGLNLPLKAVDRLTGLDARHKRAADKELTLHSLQVGLSAFTPDEIENPDPIFDDRPYSSLLFLQTRRQSVDLASDFALTTELSLGILGLSIAEDVQRWIHEHMQDFPGDDPKTPRGWSNQISDGGELTARYGVKGQWLINCDRNYDVQLTGEANLGYFTNVTAGVGARLGKIRSPWWNFSSTPIKESSLFSSRSGGDRGRCPSRNSTTTWELYGWGGASASYWLYNVLLEGQFRDSAVKVSGANVERTVADYQYGVTGGFIAVDLWWNLTYARTRRTAEFDSLLNKRSHSWGSIFLTISRPY